MQRQLRHRPSPSSDPSSTVRRAALCRTRALGPVHPCEWFLYSTHAVGEWCPPNLNARSSTQTSSRINVAEMRSKNDSFVCPECAKRTLHPACVVHDLYVSTTHNVNKFSSAAHELRTRPKRRRSGAPKRTGVDQTNQGVRFWFLFNHHLLVRIATLTQSTSPRLRSYTFTMFPLGSPGGVVSYPLAMFVVGLCLTSPRNVAWILQLGGLASQGPLPFVHYLAMLVTGEAEDSQTLEVCKTSHVPTLLPTEHPAAQ